MGAGDFAFLSAVAAPYAQRQHDSLNFGALGGGSFCKHIQIDLNTFRNDAAEGTNAQTDDTDFGRALFLSGFERNGQNTFCDSQFMHKSPSFFD